LIWATPESYLRLDVGTGGPREVFFSGCIENRDAVFGRGQLPFKTGLPEAPVAVHLRFERSAERVRALCSEDGEAWFRVGEADFAVDGPLQVGLYANGEIDRVIHPGSHPKGTAIRFLLFQQWEFAKD
jgi:hypothetical protein